MRILAAPPGIPRGLIPYPFFRRPGFFGSGLLCRKVDTLKKGYVGYDVSLQVENRAGLVTLTRKDPRFPLRLAKAQMGVSENRGP